MSGISVIPVHECKGKDPHFCEICGSKIHWRAFQKTSDGREFISKHYLLINVEQDILIVTCQRCKKTWRT